jgi:hypothetical protein
MSSWPDRAVYGCGGDPIDDDIADELRRSKSIEKHHSWLIYADKVRSLLFGLRDSGPGCTVAAWWWA